MIFHFCMGILSNIFRFCCIFSLVFFQELDTLHAAIILLKPNEARLTSSFEYCVTDLLNFFPKDFAKNISKFGLSFIGIFIIDKYFVRPMHEPMAFVGEIPGEQFKNYSKD